MHANSYTEVKLGGQGGPDILKDVVVVVVVVVISRCDLSGLPQQLVVFHRCCPCLFQLLANVVIYACVITVGVMSYYMADRKHRKAFLEARQSLEVKLNLEEQSQQQVQQTFMSFFM